MIMFFAALLHKTVCVCTQGKLEGGGEWGSWTDYIEPLARAV